MTENRRLGDLELGHPGLLTYIPAENPDLGPGLLHTARLTTSTLRFDIFGSCVELYPPSRTANPWVSSQLWRERQLQRRWLLKIHPEAFMGNQSFPGYLKEDMERFRRAEEMTQRRPLLAVGLMSDLRDAPAAQGMPLLAVATGESGEQLRLMRMDESRWQWGEETDAVLHLSVIDSDCKEEEALWTTDAVPISQVKATTYSSPNNSVRWLLVQKPTSTTILQPEYHPYPVPDDDAAGDSTHPRPSYIDPNPLLTLHHHQTGGNAHSDVSFNQPALNRPPQLAVLDECGYWTIWNILGTWRIGKKTLHLFQHRCGHICEGFLDAVPSYPAYPADRYGLLHVGNLEPEGGGRAPARQAGNLQATSPPSRYMLMWNSELCEVLDVESNSALPMPELLSRIRTTTDQILDIQRSLLNEDQVFVLTAQRLIWLDLHCRDALSGGSQKPTIVHACSHFGIGHQEMRMSVTRASADDADTSLVFTYSFKAKQLCVYWFGFSRVANAPQWHRDVTQLPGAAEMASRSGIRQLRVHPARLERYPWRSPTGPGSSFLQRGFNFYQVNILGEDLGVRYCICTTSTDPAFEVSLPSTRIGWSRSEQRRRWKKKRKQFLRRIKDAFVLPDGMGEADMESALVETDEVVEAPPHDSGDDSSWEPKPVLLKTGRISQAIRERVTLAAARGEPMMSAALFDAVYAVLEDGLLNGSLPLTTWTEIADDLDQPTAHQVAEDAMEESAKRLLDVSDDRAIVTQLRGHEPWEPSKPLLVLSMLKRQLSEFWLDSAVGKSSELEQARMIWVSGIAKDVFLSSHGVMVQDVPLLGSDGSGAGDEDGPAAFSSQLSSRSPRISPSSQLEPSSSASVPWASADPAMRRLRLLVPSLEPGNLGSAKCPKILSFWPTERGVETGDYVSSVAISTEEKFKDAKDRLQRREAKRRALAERYRRPAFMRQGFPTCEEPGSDAATLPPRPPPMQIISSQQAAPESSQTQGPWVTMSQPVAGVFRDGKKGKKGKRKNGFR